MNTLFTRLKKDNKRIIKLGTIDCIMTFAFIVVAVIAGVVVTTTGVGVTSGVLTGMLNVILQFESYSPRSK